MLPVCADVLFDRIVTLYKNAAMNEICRSSSFLTGLLAAILVMSLSSAANSADSTATAIPENADTLVRKLDETRYAIGNLIIDKSRGTIDAPGRINMNRGLIEYLAVTSYGKTHEATFILDIQPLHLQVALLLLGLDYGRNLDCQGDTTRPAGDSVAIYIKWANSEGDSSHYSASELILDYRTDTTLPETRWVFTGSRVHEGYFLADDDGSIIATYNDPMAILNNPRPERIDDTILGSNHFLLPEIGTKIVMVIAK